MKLTILLLSTLLTITSVYSQIEIPPLSPTFELKGTVGFSDVTVKYSRPSARERDVVGNLIPYGEVWRTGANASTKITFSEDVSLNGNPVAAGEYALYTIFSEEMATIILSKNLSWWGAMGYDPADDVVRFDVKVKHPSSHYETFTISFSDFTRSSANFNMKWEHTKAMFKIESDVDGKVVADIKAQLIDNTSTDPRILFDAAAYYYETDLNPELALGWVNKAVDNSENTQYWVIHLQAKLLAKNGNKKEAILAAQKSAEWAKKGGNADYVRLNEKLIASLK